MYNLSDYSKMKENMLDKILEYYNEIKSMRSTLDSIEFIESLSNDIIKYQELVESISEKVSDVPEELIEGLQSIIEKYNLTYTHKCGACKALEEEIDSILDEVTDEKNNKFEYNDVEDYYQEDYSDDLDFE